MKKLNGNTVLRIAALALSVAGTIVTSIVHDKKTEETLKKLVEEKLGQN